MYHIRSVVFVLSIPFTLAACLEDSTTPLEPATVEESMESLSFNMPPLDPALLSPVTVTVHEPPPSGRPQASEMDADMERPVQAIFGAKTTTGFFTGMAYAEGQHSYTGNVGGVETTARVTIEDKYLADQVAKEQDYTPFLFDFGLKKFISAFAPVYTDHKCGLTVGGSSLHSAAWQFFQGVGVSNWGQTLQSTVAPSASQSPCAAPSTGHMTGGVAGSGGSVCYYYITYDLVSGQIYGADLLFCTSGSDEKW